MTNEQGPVRKIIIDADKLTLGATEGLDACGISATMIADWLSKYTETPREEIDALPAADLVGIRHAIRMQFLDGAMDAGVLSDVLKRDAITVKNLITLQDAKTTADVIQWLEEFTTLSSTEVRALPGYLTNFAYYQVYVSLRG